MATDMPTTTAQWVIHFDRGMDGLQLIHDAAIPPLGPTSCLVKIAAVSLNYRDVAMATGLYPMSFQSRIIPCSDGAGTVVAVGKNVTLHKAGDQVCTLFSQGHQTGFVTPAIRQTSLGSKLDGVLRQYAVFDETGLVSTPTTYSLLEACTLPCAALTAWNALYGVEGRSLRAGDTVLVQGTGGVSVFAAQIAVAAGATVIATTSSNAKADKLKRTIGVHYVINYKTDEHWGKTARQLTPDQGGAQHIIEVGGERTMQQSLAAVRCEGVISVVGFLGGKPKAGEELCSFTDVLSLAAIVRGINIGSKGQFQQMNEFIDQHRLKPVIDEKIFKFDEAREAYQYLLDQKHWGKVVIAIE